MRQLNRIVPKLGPESYKTFGIVAPPATHWRPATCDEYGCEQYRNGWMTPVDERTELGQRQAYYIRKQSGRSFREERNEAGLTTFTFSAGQPCFRSGDHQVRTGRPELYVVRGGDWRGNPRGIEPYVHKNAENWVDQFANHQQTLADAQQEG